MIPRLAKGLIVHPAYVILRLLHLYSAFMTNPALKSLELVYVIPFSYMFLCRLGDAYTIESAFSRRYYDFLLQRSGSGSVIIDIGAHIGSFTVRASRKIGRDGYVVAVEPEQENAELLAINCVLNRCKNVKILKVACGRRNGYAHLYLHDFTGHSIKIPSSERIPIRVVSLDTLTSMFRKLRPSGYIIKINAEGGGARHSSGLF